jgi:para-aminobenzoate synthetase component 1
MELSNSIFWMDGQLATDCVEISRDPKSLDQPGFWAVVQNFESEFLAARFASVTRASLPVATWEKLDTNWSTSQSKNEYEVNVDRIKDLIARGEVYQVNLCRVLSANSAQSLLGLANLILQENPSPYAAYLKLPGIEIASASPELFLSREGNLIKSSPIKGTSETSDFGEKDTAENIMIVDLMRNDFSQISKAGTVDVPRILATEKHPGLYHLVSDVVGEIGDDVKWPQILNVLTPAGSISGAPKSSALKTIQELENDKRGPYCGVIGWSQENRANLSVGIRIFWSYEDGQIHFGTGAGITWQSQAAAEWEETELKARRLISIAGGNQR